MKYFQTIIIFSLILLLAITQTINAQNVNLTFRVDMSQQVVSANGVHVAGTFQTEAGYSSNWDPAATELTDPDADNVYETTVTLPPGTYLYKFINGNSWGDQPENPSADCAFDDGAGNMNRQVVLGNYDRVLPIVMFDSCNAIVTFSVNMSNESISANGVHVMGNFQTAAGYPNDWDAGKIEMFDDNNDTIYEANIQIPPGNYQFVYVNGNENTNRETPPTDCTIDDGNGNPVREFTAAVGMAPLQTYYYNTCETMTVSANYETYWWNDAVFYEIFVRSFKDSDGDGIGDFQGIIEMLDYLNDGDPSTNSDLGITGIWLMPMMESPSYHGYDATDYYATEPDYGTMQDFEELVDEAHARGIKIILDLVMNHCSNQHPWFTQSANNQNNYRDWFVWSDTDPGFTGPWGQDVWHYNNGSYYYGIFWSGMPDLNYSHEPVKTEMFNVAEFWLNKGVDGFRLDAIKYLDEDGTVLENTPETFQLLEDFNDMYKGVNPDAFTVGEVWSSTSTVIPYVQNDRLDVCFEFDLAGSIINSVQGQNPSVLLNKMQNIQNSYAKLQYATFLTNHDMDRIFSVMGENTANMKLAATIYLTLPGIPFIYYGEEVGMTGTGAHENIRRPMQWTNGTHAGFSTSTPWQSLGDNYATNNVADMQNDPNSLLQHYKNIIHIRNNNETLRKGYFLPVNNSENLLSFARIFNNEATIVVSNLSDAAIQPNLTLGISSLTAGNYNVFEYTTETNLDSLAIGVNGDFENWQPATGEIEPKTTQIFYLSQNSNVSIPNNGETKTQFILYPNPTKDLVYIKLNIENSNSACAKLFDVHGKLLSQSELNKNINEINVAHLKPGLYFVKVSTLKQSQVMRLVVSE
jgi:glycosidase